MTDYIALWTGCPDHEQWQASRPAYPLDIAYWLRRYWLAPDPELEAVMAVFERPRRAAA
jgi:hypothetical protein